MLETNMEDSHLYTLDLHMRYVGRTLYEYGTNRLPHRLSKHIIQKNLLWVEKQQQMCRQLNMTWEYSNQSLLYWNQKSNLLLEKMRIESRKEYMQSAINTDRFYKNLDFSKGSYYMTDENTKTAIMWIFKARCDLIELNATRFATNRSKICSLCNLNEDESVQHFIGRCPILREFRLRHFSSAVLQNDVIVNILNGRYMGWTNLVQYIINALKYRKILIDEYNY